MNETSDLPINNSQKIDLDEDYNKSVNHDLVSQKSADDIKSINSNDLLTYQINMKNEKSFSKNKSQPQMDDESIENSELSKETQHANQIKIKNFLNKEIQNKMNLKESKSKSKRIKTFAEELDEEQIILPNINNKYENTKNVESDMDEDTHFGQGVFLKDGSISQIPNETPDNWKPNLIIANIIHIFLIISGIYCCFLGFRFFKMTMILLGLDFSYYFIILFLTEFDIYDIENIGHQLGVFFGSLLLGLAVSILSYLFEKTQFFIIGVSIGSMISVFIAQFFINFEDNSDKILILSIYIGSSLVFTIAAYAAQHSTLIWGTVIVGSILATLNFGVLLNDFKSFEQREKLPNDRYSDFINYLIANAVLICLGLLVQFYLKKKIIQHLKKQDKELDSDMYTIRATTFL